MDKIIFRLTIAFLAVLSIALVANASTYVIYYPEIENIKSNDGFIADNDLHIIIKTKHSINQNNYCYMKLIRNVSPSDKFLVMPDKNTNTLEVKKYE